eukprot:s4372_g2.t1
MYTVPWLMQLWPLCAGHSLRPAGIYAFPAFRYHMLQLAHEQPCAPHYQGRSHYAVHALRTAGPVREVTLYGMQGAERVAQRHRLGQVCIALILNDFR